MRFERTELDGAWLIGLEPASDQRGFFARTFCTREFAEHGLKTVFVQHSTSYSTRRGTIRGMHFQRDPAAEVKVVNCVRGAIYDVIVDLTQEARQPTDAGRASSSRPKTGAAFTFRPAMRTASRR